MFNYGQQKKKKKKFQSKMLRYGEKSYGDEDDNDNDDAQANLRPKYISLD